MAVQNAASRRTLADDAEMRTIAPDASQPHKHDHDRHHENDDHEHDHDHDHPFEWTEALRIAVVAVTADTSPERHTACSRAGFNGLIEKPVRPRQLVATLAGILIHGTTQPRAARA